MILISKNSVLIPPAQIIKDLKLHFDSRKSGWCDINNNIIIVCNKRNPTFDNGAIFGSIYINNDVFNDYVKTHFYHFFGFTEKYYYPNPFSDKSSFDFELINDDFKDIKLHCMNDNVNYSYVQKDKCKKCKNNKVKNDNQFNSTNIKDLLALYNIKEDLDSNE